MTIKHVKKNISAEKDYVITGVEDNPNGILTFTLTNLHDEIDTTLTIDLSKHRLKFFKVTEEELNALRTSTNPEDIKNRESHFYLVPKDPTNDEGIYQEFMWVGNDFELLGSTYIDLEPYFLKANVYNKLDYPNNDNSHALSAYQGKVLNDRKEEVSNKKTSWQEIVTNTAYPSEQLVYESILESIDKAKELLEGSQDLDKNVLEEFLDNFAEKLNSIPTKTSDLINDSDFIKEADVIRELENKVDKTDMENYLGIDVANSTYIPKVDIVNNLTTSDSSKVLSAQQGKALQDSKANKTDLNSYLTVTNASNTYISKSKIKDTLDSTSSEEVLSAKQGKILNDTKADKTTLNNYLTISNASTTYIPKSNIIDALNSTSSEEVLSAKQGKILNDSKAPLVHTHGSLQSDGRVGTSNNASKNVVTDSNGKITTESKPTVPSANTDSSKIQMDGTKSAGGSSTTAYAKADHVHPTDTSRAPVNHTHTKSQISDFPTIPSANTTNTNIKMNGTQSAGSLATFAKADHVHPTDTSRAPTSHTHTKSQITDFPTSMTPTSHSHGDITNNGTIGTTANKPLITGNNGVITTGNFGTSANTFCQGNDSRLSDARTPKPHTHNASDIADLFNVVYPVGAIYMSFQSTSPAILFGGTWEQIKDSFLWATSTIADTVRTPPANQGSKDATLVKHSHPSTSHSHKGANDNYFLTSTGVALNPRETKENAANDDSGWYYVTADGTSGIQRKTDTASADVTTPDCDGSDGIGKNMPPYLKVFMWVRIR